MAMVSGPTGISNDYYDSSIENPSPKEASAIADQPQAEPGETENRMKAEEALQRALSSNLGLLQREQAAIAQINTVNHAHERFPLVIELFKISVEKCKAAGLSVQELATELKSRLQNNVLTPFEGPHADLKTDLCGTYLRLMGLANEIGQAKDLPYTSPSLKLFELEKDTGFSIQGILHLQKEYLDSKAIVDESLKKETSFSNFRNWLRYSVNAELDSPQLAQFYRETFIPNTQKIIGLLEKEGDLTALKGIVESYLKVVIAMYPLCPPPIKETQDPSILTHLEQSVRTEYAYAQQHPFILSLPSIAKYASPEAVKLVLHRSDLFLVLFYCEKAEIMATTDQKQAQHYLKQAEQVTNSIFFWDRRRSMVEELQKSKALNRIAEIKAKLKQ